MKGDNKSKVEIDSLDGIFKNADDKKEADKRAEKRHLNSHRRIKEYKKKEEKKTVDVSEMHPLKLYSVHGVMYRKVDGVLEKLSNGNWVKVKMTIEIVMNTEFMEY